jgi:hypothetical protein
LRLDVKPDIQPFPDEAAGRLWPGQLPRVPVSLVFSLPAPGVPALLPIVAPGADVGAVRTRRWPDVHLTRTLEA